MDCDLSAAAETMYPTSAVGTLGLDYEIGRHSVWQQFLSLTHTQARLIPSLSDRRVRSKHRNMRDVGEVFLSGD